MYFNTICYSCVTLQLHESSWIILRTSGSQRHSARFLFLFIIIDPSILPVSVGGVPWMTRRTTTIHIQWYIFYFLHTERFFSYRSFPVIVVIHQIVAAVSHTCSLSVTHRTGNVHSYVIHGKQNGPSPSSSVTTYTGSLLFSPIIFHSPKILGTNQGDKE